MWVLVAVALAMNSSEPYVQHRLYADKQECRDAAVKYVKQGLTSQHRAFCLKVKEKL